MTVQQIQVRECPEHPSKRAFGITQAMAVQVAVAVRTFDPNIDVTVYPPGFHSGGWTIAAEGSGRDCWPFEFSEWVSYGEAPEVIKRKIGPLLLEPVSHWCLGVYNP